MIDRGAIVDERPSPPGIQERLHVGDAPFQLERGGDAVPCLVLVRGRALAVGVEVHEARRQYQSGSVDQDASVDEGLGEGPGPSRRR